MTRGKRTEMNKRTLLASIALISVLMLVLAAPAMAKNDRTFGAHLSGANEVPAVETNASGQAIFKLSKDGTELSYKLIVANIEDVMQAHIHVAPAGENGAVVAWLYPSGPPPVLIPGVSQGVLATGTITAASLVGPLAGQPLSALLDAMKAGNTYTNVHTTANPGGEIRGQIR
jgi:hypothetical protein